MFSFGEKLKHLREKRGETQEDIAKILKISRTSISKYESGDREPDIETIKILSKHFDVSVDFIFGLNESASCIDTGCIGLNQTIGLSYREELQQIMFNENFIRLAAKIKENNLDIGLIENLIENVIKLNKG